MKYGALLLFCTPVVLTKYWLMLRDELTAALVSVWKFCSRPCDSKE